jgi:hypothetical protein
MTFDGLTAVMVNRFLGTIVTAFPERKHQGDETADRTLQKSLLRGFKESQPRSAEELIALVVSRCINFVDIPFKAGLQEPVFGMFATSIAEQVSTVGISHF